MLAAGPPLGGRPRRAPSQGPDSNPWALAAANPSASRRGQAGDPLVPGGPAPQGHGEPEPRAEGTGAHQQPRRCPSTPGRAACSAELAACFCSPEHFAGGFEGGRRPPAARPRPPPFRPLGPQPPPRLLQKGARTHRQAPGKAPGARLQDPALSRAAPPPKVFSLRPTPGTILGLRPSKYLPQSPGQSSGHSRAPPGPRGLPGARTRPPTPPPARPSRMEVTERGSWKRALCPPAGMRGPPPRVPDYKSAPLPISSLAGSSSSSEARRLLLAQDSSGRPSRIASRDPGHYPF
ncbi:basic salivary proline-rich protein 1-like [Physeter macrocephalus]|uniref:Basic salivary proline-rich protein 1-like n=1 Tax=Physeter macrocephalus TaxID=9755 RepID=A0A2Y9SZH7_PHYMC|nr:basic salivary proline-rich protein 1-like [Physeter catodon]|eukprot:XP_023983548.1 basic salivary proline-rich protein 1-like [Physeter catodon]